MQSLISEIQTDSDIKKSSLQLLRCLEKNLTSKECQSIIDLILHLAKINYDLDDSEIQDIKDKTKKSKRFCNHVYKTGPWTGTKCLNEKKSGEIFCEKHL